jgi:putative transposase
MGINPKLIDQLLAGYKKPEDIAGESGLPKQLTKAVIEWALQAELTGHPGYEKNDPAGYKSRNPRNGKSRKKLKGDFGEIELKTPRGIVRRRSSHCWWFQCSIAPWCWT